MKISEKEFLSYCEHGTLKRYVNAYFKKKGMTQKAINILVKKLKKEDKIQEVTIPQGRLLVTLHYKKRKSD